MAAITTKRRTIEVKNLDNGNHVFNIEVYNTNENHVRGYRAVNLKGGEIATKYYMEHVTIIEVTAAFRKLIREQNRLNFK